MCFSRMVISSCSSILTVMRVYANSNGTNSPAGYSLELEIIIYRGLLTMNWISYQVLMEK